MSDVLRLSDLCSGPGSVEVSVQVLRGDDSILGQYVEFCQIADEQRTIHGLTKTAIQETMRICQDRAILVPFLTTSRKEVIDIMEMLFSQEEVWEMTKKEIRQEEREAGIRAMITTLQELSFNQDTIVQKLVSKFALPLQDASAKVKQYWVQ